MVGATYSEMEVNVLYLYIKQNKRSSTGCSFGDKIMYPVK